MNLTSETQLSKQLILFNNVLFYLQ